MRISPPAQPHLLSNNDSTQENLSSACGTGEAVISEDISLPLGTGTPGLLHGLLGLLMFQLQKTNSPRLGCVQPVVYGRSLWRFLTGLERLRKAVCMPLLSEAGGSRSVQKGLSLPFGPTVARAGDPGPCKRVCRAAPRRHPRPVCAVWGRRMCTGVNGSGRGLREGRRGLGLSLRPGTDLASSGALTSPAGQAGSQCGTALCHGAEPRKTAVVKQRYFHPTQALLASGSAGLPTL